MRPLTNSLMVGAAVVALGAAPVVPHEMTFLYAYDYYIPTVLDAATSTNNALPVYLDADKDGVIYIAVFGDEYGNRNNIELTKSDYESLGVINGARNNPSFTEYLPLVTVEVA